MGKAGDFDSFERPLRKFGPKMSYADSKGADANALRDEIDSVYTKGLSKLFDDEDVELQKLNALQKQIMIEEEQINIQMI